jgi:hypothetical protein
MKIVCKNKKNYLKVLISFFLSVVVFCSLTLTVFGANTLVPVSADSLYTENGLTYFNANNTSYCIYYNSSNGVSICYSAGAHFFRYNGTTLIPCASDGTYLSCRCIDFPNLETAIDFITNYSAEKFADDNGEITFYYINGSYGFSCVYTNVIYNNRQIRSASKESSGTVLKGIVEIEADSSDTDDSGSEDSNILDRILEAIKSIPEKSTEFKNEFLETWNGFKNYLSDCLSVLKSFFTFSEDFSDKLTEACTDSVNDNKTISGLLGFFTDLKDFFGDATRQTKQNFNFNLEGHEIDYWTDVKSGAHPEKYIGDSTSFKLDFSYINPYMPRIRNILSIFIWIGFLYRVWFRLPSILQGLGGDEAMTDIILPDVATKIKNRKAKKQQKNKTSKGG